MKSEQLHSDHEGDAWMDKEHTRTEGYGNERLKQTKQTRKEDDEKAKQERINKIGRDAFKKITKKSEIQPPEKNPNDFELK